MLVAVAQLGPVSQSVLAGSVGMDRTTLTRNLQPLHYEPGSVILQEGERDDKFYIITSGQAEVTIQRPDASDLVVAIMDVGQYFGEIKLLRGGVSRASVRAGGMTPVEVLALDEKTFSQIMAESDTTRQALEQIATSRMAVNIDARDGGEE